MASTPRRSPAKSGSRANTFTFCTIGALTLNSHVAAAPTTLQSPERSTIVNPEPMLVQDSPLRHHLHQASSFLSRLDSTIRDHVPKVHIKPTTIDLDTSIDGAGDPTRTTHGHGLSDHGSDPFTADDEDPFFVRALEKLKAGLNVESDEEIWKLAWKSLEGLAHAGHGENKHKSEIITNMKDDKSNDKTLKVKPDDSLLEFSPYGALRRYNVNILDRDGNVEGGVTVIGRVDPISMTGKLPSSGARERPKGKWRISNDQPARIGDQGCEHDDAVFEGEGRKRGEDDL